MTKFRIKSMPLEEWKPFQDRFGDLQLMMKGDKRLALFIHTEPGTDRDLLLIPAFQSDLVEALSPGGWSDAEDIEGLGWGLLVGTASSNEDYGLPTPGEVRRDCD